MKKIGILFGHDNTYPQALIDKINNKNDSEIKAEFVKIDKVILEEPAEYSVIIDRISQDVAFYKAYLKNAALNGTAVINNPFRENADDRFFNNSLAKKLGLNIPKTVLLPSNQHPEGTDSNTFRNLEYPLNWDKIFSYTGFPAYLKPYTGGNWKDFFKINDSKDFFKAYNGTGKLIMMLQEYIGFEEYYKCFCVDRKSVHIMKYNPDKQDHQKFKKENSKIDDSLKYKIEELVIKINKAIGYDINTVDVAVKDEKIYAIDICNPVPVVDRYLLGNNNFDWVVNSTAEMAIKRAKENVEGKINLTWGEFIKTSIKDERLT